MKKEQQHILHGIVFVGSFYRLPSGYWSPGQMSRFEKRVGASLEFIIVMVDSMPPKQQLDAHASKHMGIQYA